MARKYTKTTPKASPPRRQAPASRGRSAPARSSGTRSEPAKKTPVATGGPGRFETLRKLIDQFTQQRASAARRQARDTGRKPTADRQSPTAGRGSSSPRSTLPAPPTEPAPMSLDRKLDLIGVGMAIVGLLLLLVLFSANHSGITGTGLALLTRFFGWGAYLFPITLLAVGVWLILRNFERIPWPSLERLVGVTLLFLCLLALFHAWAQGGTIGAVLYSTLDNNLGPGGTLIALLAWMLIAIVFTLDMTAGDLFRWVPPLIMRFQDAWDDWRTRHLAPISGRRSPIQSPAPVAVSAGSQPDPLNPQPTSRDTKMPITWVLPPVDQILDPGHEVTHDDDVDRQRAHTIEQTLASFGAPVNVIEINRGPTITQFGVEPDFIESRGGRMRVRVGKIASLADDLALALSARTIRVQAPVPGKGFVGIEVPNETIASVALRDAIESEAFRRLKSPLRFALGQDVAGNAVAAALDAMPHLLIAGTTGSGKSVCVNALISCLLIHNTPDDLRLIMVDPKRVELTGYNGIPHLLAPVVVEMERVVGALQWVLREMDTRYHKLAKIGARNITEYNAKAFERGEKKMPRLVVIIDELADLMMLAPDETEKSITRLAQLARATGIHLVIATQRPSVDVVTGLIKANVPARIAFAVASGVDSRVILDQPGAETLLGRGDMLFQAPDSPAAIRLQGAYVSDVEIQRLVDYWRGFTGTVEPTPTATGGVVDALPPGIPLKQMPLWEDLFAEQNGDPLLSEAIDIARRQGRASISMLQRRLRIGYTRGARLIEAMQAKNIIGKDAGPQGFEILDYGPAGPPPEEN